jgi:rhodanese-related sulfurtransferase
MISPSAATAIAALSPETLGTWIAEHQDLVVIDVRFAAEFESMHIRGSYNVPLPLLSEHTNEPRWLPNPEGQALVAAIRECKRKRRPAPSRCSRR